MKNKYITVQKSKILFQKLIPIQYYNINTKLFDLNNDIIEIIGDYVKKDNLNRAFINEEQTLKGRKIRFDNHFQTITPAQQKTVKDLMSSKIIHDFNS